MSDRPLKIAGIAGEVSETPARGDLIAQLKVMHTTGRSKLVGVGGDALESQGLKSLFDFSELSIMGFTQVLSKLQRLINLISITLPMRS